MNTFNLVIGLFNYRNYLYILGVILLSRDKIFQHFGASQVAL